MTAARGERDDVAEADPAGPGNAIQKVCAVLRTVGARSPQRLSEIVATTGLNKVTALRIIDTLIQEGFLQKIPDAGPGYARGRELMALAAGADRSPDLRELVRPSLVRLADMSEDTSLLSVRSGVESVCIERQMGSFPIRASYLDIGSRRPLGVGAGSMALLAWLPDREIDAILSAITPKLGPYPRLPVDEMRRIIVRSRESGIVVLLDQVIDKMSAIGLPLRDPQGRVVGALSIAALTERIRDRQAELGDALAREADLVLREMTLGHRAMEMSI